MISVYSPAVLSARPADFLHITAACLALNPYDGFHLRQFFLQFLRLYDVGFLSGQSDMLILSLRAFIPQSTR